MAVIKLTASKQAVQFIDEEGNVFQTSIQWIKQLVNNSTPGGFILLSRLPHKVGVDRFKKSPVYGDVLPDSNNTTYKEDALSLKSREEKKSGDQYKDKAVWQ